MALKLGELVAYLKVDDKGLELGLAEGRAKVQASGRDMQRDADSTGRGIGSALARGIRSPALAAAAGAGALALGLGSVAANAIAVASAVAPAAATVALLPAGLLAAAAATAVFKFAFGGLGAAMQQTSSGASSSTASLIAAERRLTTAQRGALQAQEALNTARKDAALRARDLSRNLSGAALDEEAAAAAVARAKADLAAAPASGDPNAVGAAQLALRQAEQQLAEVRDRVADLKAEKADADATGVEGSKLVVDALRNQADAVQEVTDAQKALKEAQSGGGGGGGPNLLAKLSPAGRELVATLKDLTPRWHGFRNAVQQSALTGVAGDVRQLSDTYLPVLTQRFVGVGNAANVAIRSALGFLKTPAAVTMVDNTLANVVRTFDRLALAVKPALNAFLMISEVGSGALPGIGDGVLSLALRFERFIASAKESGKLGEWIGAGLTVLKQLGIIAWNVVGAVVAIFRAGGASEGAGFLTWLTDATGRLKTFLNSTEGQDKISGVLTTLRDIVDKVVASVKDLDGNGASVGDTFKASSVIVKILADNLGLVADHLPLIVALFVAYKTAQAAANVVSVARVGIDAVALVRNWGMVGALAAHTAALTANSAAAGVGATVTTASGVAAGGASTGFWALTAALLANPITWIVLAVIALVAIIVLLATKTQFFQKTWEIVWGFLKDVGAWFAGPFANFFVDGYHKVVGYLGLVWDYAKSLPGKLKDAFFKVTDFITAPFRLAFNTVSRLWNSTIGKLHWNVPNWVPGIGGNSLSAPQLPQLAGGGVVPATPGGRAVVVAEGGEDEIVSPKSQLAAIFRDVLASSGGGQGVTVNLVVDGQIIETKTVAAIRGNPVEVALANRAGSKSLEFAG